VKYFGTALECPGNLFLHTTRNNKEEDTFGEKDSDWDVYKQISREAEDSDSEEETLRAQVPVPF
jgi:hypothetical protein